MVVGTLLWPTLMPAVQSWQRQPRVPLLVVGMVLTVVGTVWALWGSRHVGRAERRASSAELAASEHLRELRYQSSMSRTRNGKVSLPGGLELGTSGQVQRTEQARTYPDWSDSSAACSSWWPWSGGRGRRVVVGVDDLDKMATAEEAERFLNDFKAVFGVRGCYFLVAVAEDALAAFDRRTLGVRTTFDSAFDIIVRVPPLAVTEAWSLLQQRGVGLPEPFLWLCHAMSGGLPRGLLRSVMGLATTASLRQLSALARELIAQDVATVLAAQVRYASAMTGP
jgi:hypothetical protein